MEIKCKFDVKNDVYECQVLNASITHRFEIESFNGKHGWGKTSNDVQVLIFSNTTVHYIPMGLSKNFPKLKKLEVTNCGLKDIVAKDLLGLIHLEELVLASNNLKSLPENLFTCTKKLHTANFKDNKLEFMSSQMFDTIPDRQWWLIDLQNNTKINSLYFSNGLLGWFRAIKALKHLKGLISASCTCSTVQPDKNAKILGSATSEFKKLWEQQKYFDFTVSVGLTEIKVHKCVLAVRSPVFASIFENDEQVKTTSQLEIKDCSENVVRDFLQSLYTGEILNENNALELFSLACTFEVEDLQKSFEEIAITNLTDKNAIDAFKVGNFYKSEKIIDAAYTKIGKMLPDHLQGDLKQDPERVEEIYEKFMAYKKSLD